MEKEKWKKNLLQHYYDGKDLKEVCPYCGKEGCTCGPDCECKTKKSQDKLNFGTDFE